MNQKEREDRWRENSHRSEIIGKVMNLMELRKIPYEKPAIVLFAQDMIMQGREDPEDIINSWKLREVAGNI